MSSLSLRRLWKGLSTATLMAVGLLLAGPNGPARAGPILDPVGDFLPTYTGPQDPGLDAVAHEVTLVGDRLNFFGQMAGPIAPTQAIGGLFLIGVDRGLGTPRFLNSPAAPPAIGPNVKWDAIVRIFPNGTAFYLNSLLGVTTPLPTSDISIIGNEFNVSVPVSLMLPSATKPPAEWTYNLWPRNGVGLNVQVSDLAPDDGNSPVHAVPEPVSLTLCGIGALGLAGCGWRRRRHTAREVVARRQRKQHPMTKHWMLLVTASLATLLALFAPTPLARADIFEWEYINPANPGEGKQQSTMLCPDGAGAYAGPATNLSSRNLTMAYLIGADLSAYTYCDYDQWGNEYCYYGYSDLTGANLSQADLTSARLYGAALTNVNFSQANLTNANFEWATLTDADFTGAEVRGANFWYTGITAAQLSSTASYLAHDLTGIGLRGNNLAAANLAGQNLTGANFQYATLTGANLTGAEVRGANFFSSNITAAQLYSTASYQAYDLTGIDLGDIDLPGVNLAGQNLTNANLYAAGLTGANFSQANLTNANFGSASAYAISDLTGANLSQANLTNANFVWATLTNANFTQANLTNADLRLATLTGANLTGAEVRGAIFDRNNSGGTGITPAQLYSTASYLAHDLTGIGLTGNNLAGANLAGQNLTNAVLGIATLTNVNFSQANLTNANIGGATLTDADFTGAEVRGANFSNGSGTGITKAQLYSTANYQAHDLTGIGLYGNNLAGWNFTGQNLTNAGFNAATLTGANLSGAEVRGAQFANTGITKAQLYSTASYQAHDLTGIGLYNNNLAGVNLAGQNLTNANFSYSTLTNANFSQANLTNASFSGYGDYYYTDLTGANLSGADARGAYFQYATLSGANTSNLIQSDGHILGLDLTAGASLVVRDYDGNPAAPNGPLAIFVEEHMATDSTGALRLVFDADPWDSTISFAPGVPIALGGTLDLTFAPGVDVATQSGRTIDLFDWTGVAPTGAFTISSPYTWNLSNLYTTGEVTLAAAPIIPGDFNGDSVVDAADLAQWQGDFGLNGDSDADNDGDSDGADFLTWQRQLGSGAPAIVSSASVPEPSTAMLLLMGYAGMLTSQGGLHRKPHANPQTQ